MQTLTPDKLRQFGPGDQIHVIYPESGHRVVASITQIILRPRGNDNQDLKVDFEGAVWFMDDMLSEPRPDLCFYETEVCLCDLIVAREDDGFMEVPNLPAEQVILFLKPTHQFYVPINR